jgi:hypothetical protein
MARPKYKHPPGPIKAFLISGPMQVVSLIVVLLSLVALYMGYVGGALVPMSEGSEPLYHQAFALGMFFLGTFLVPIGIRINEDNCEDTLLDLILVCGGILLVVAVPLLYVPRYGL